VNSFGDPVCCYLYVPYICRRSQTSSYLGASLHVSSEMALDISILPVLALLELGARRLSHAPAAYIGLSRRAA